MGLAVAEGLLKKGGWNVHLLDVNAQRGQETATKLGDRAHFYQTNVTSYASLAGVFERVFKSEGRLDFVFANAGIVERWNFYETHSGSGPPPEPDQAVIDINLKAVISTSYLAQHYFRLCPTKDAAGQSLIMTASTGGLYKAPFCSMYTASKHGVVGFMRSIADHYYAHDNIRVNAICPSSVRTNLLDDSAWSEFPQEYFTPIEKIVETVLMLIEGGDLVDTKGVKIPQGKDFGRAVEISQTNHYFREQVEYSDDVLRAMMAATDVAADETQDKRFAKS
ncbi:NAD(P)-binding protein [Microthyrium microscopicum]|uniref:NAD(P)-binding protein n=1 Tax=Microthyrium microscopicum TaxID=703497 RepID=A0A6A6UJE1_9PEZI|nr:NAD(P)-binding protein [Microthyrium microscopicum]